MFFYWILIILGIAVGFFMIIAQDFKIILGLILENIDKFWINDDSNGLLTSVLEVFISYLTIIFSAIFKSSTIYCDNTDSDSSNSQDNSSNSQDFSGTNNIDPALATVVVDPELEGATQQKCMQEFGHSNITEEAPIYVRISAQTSDSLKLTEEGVNKLIEDQVLFFKGQDGAEYEVTYVKNPQDRDYGYIEVSKTVYDNYSETFITYDEWGNIMDVVETNPSQNDENIAPNSSSSNNRS